MSLSGNRFGPVCLTLLVTVFGISFVGCGAPDAEFTQNMGYLRNQEFANLGDDKVSAAQLQNVADITAALFGTPDNPLVPEVPDVEVANVLDLSLIRMSSGKVSREEKDLTKGRGLYRQHCVHCHGISGDGMGPTAEFLNPYPRDFRRGKYKFKSTAFGVKPRHEDLHRILMEGISGTAMPSFKLLDSDEVESLVHYVKYLSIRGQVERELMRMATMAEAPMIEGTEDDEQPQYGDRPLLLDPENPDEFYIEEIQATVANVFASWSSAGEIDPDNTIPNPAWHAPPRPDWATAKEREQAWKRGKELFYGVGNCFSCHGELALGDGTLNIYDEWTLELEPNNEERLAEYLALGALPPRYLRPRNLRQGVFRGGRRPIDIYWRIRHGIEGSTMPAVQYRGESVREPGEEFGPESGLRADDIWSLVEYVSSLEYDQFSQSESGITFQRDRQ